MNISNISSFLYVQIVNIATILGFIVSVISLIISLDKNWRKKIINWFFNKKSKIKITLLIMSISLLLFPTMSLASLISSAFTDNGKGIILFPTENTPQVWPIAQPSITIPALPTEQPTPTARASPAFQSTPTARAPPAFQPTPTARTLPTVQPEQVYYNQIVTGPSNWFDNMTHQDNYNFSEGNGCAFVNKMYVDTATQQNGVSCFAKNVSVSGDFLFQVKMTILTGTSGGLIFGATSTNTNSNGYIVSLDTSLYYSFYLDGHINCNGVPIDANHQSCLSPFGQPGLNETNEIAILVQGHTASLFIKGKFVDKIYINMPNDAYIGFFSNYSSTGNEVAFSDAELWNL